MVNIPYKNADDELKRIKKNIENAYENFRDNYDRFNDSIRFVFVTSMTDVEQSLNKTLNRPNLQFPILEPPISRLCGEFSKNMPSIEVHAQDGAQVDGKTIEIVEGHMRHILYQANKDGFEYNMYRDTLSGGYSAAFIYSDYSNEMSFNQDICARRTHDPTMTFWDPMAHDDDKADGRFCGFLIPMYKNDFYETFDKKADKVKATNYVGSFQWTYKAQEEDVYVVADYYEKKKTKTKIVRLTNGQVVTMKEYKKFLQKWEEAGIIMQPPQIVGEPRMTELTTIVRYRLCETEILEYSETDYAGLPILFIDGNSVLYKDTNNIAVRQFTRPLVYQAKDAQRLKNFAGQALANELENMVQHKWMAPLEGIPDMYKDAYVNVQQASILIYNQFKDNDPNVRLDPPQAVPRAPIPPEIMQTFMTCDTAIQNALGAFDPSIARLGEKQVSGIAIENSLSLTNAAAMPYVVNYLKGLQSIANRILELIPKVYRTPRTIPILTKDGKKQVVEINGEGGIQINFDKNALKVKVEAGPSFEAQQTRALEEITNLMKISPMFAQFMNAKGMNVLLDNMKFRGVELLKEEANAWMQQMQQMQQQQQKQPNPEQVKMQIEGAKLKQKTEQERIENQLAMAELELERQKLEMKSAEIMAKMEGDRLAASVSMEKSQTERMTKAAEMTIKANESARKMTIEQKKLERELLKPEEEGR